MMRSKTVVLLLIPILLGSVAWAKPRPGAGGNSTPAHAGSRDGWPATREGEMARLWVEAFSSGEPAMREFLEKHQAKQGFARKSMAERMRTYRENRERFGALQFGSVVRSVPGELRVRLMASDASMSEYIFAVQRQPPYALVSVSRLETRNVGHGGFGFHH